MEKLKKISARWWFFALLLLAQTVLMPFASRNFAPQDIGRIIPATLAGAPQMQLGDWNILFQSVSLLFLVLLLVFRNRVRTLFNAYVALSYLAFAFIQNVAFTEQYGFSVVTVNLVMFLFVAYVWIREALRPQGSYDFGNFRWKYAWMIALALFAYWCPFTLRGEADLDPLHFFTHNTATAFCLTTPAFLTVLTLNLPQVNVVTYRITALVGFIIGCYNMGSFFNPGTVWLGFVHLPLLLISLYCAVLSYRHPAFRS